MKKRSLIAAIAMLVVSAIVLTSATFAWFSMGNFVDVTSFDAAVSKSDGLMISADESNWDTTITLDQISNHGAYRHIVGSTQKMFPVSSNGTSTFYTGHKEGDVVVIETIDSQETGLYYEFPVWLKYKGEGSATVNLTGTTIEPKTANNDNDVAAKQAARLAVHADGASSTTVYLPDTTGDGSLVYASATGRNPATTALTNTTTNLSNITVSLTSGTAVKVWVKLWIEGYDDQCTDELAAGGNLAVYLKFTKVA